MCCNKIYACLDYIFLMSTAALILHYVICCNRSPEFRQPCSDWRRWVGVLLILCLEGGGGNLDYPTKRTQLALRRGWGMRAVRCVGRSPVFQLRQTQTETHAHPWMQRANLEGADTSGGPRFPPVCVSAGRCGSWIRQSWSCSGTCCSTVLEKLFLYHKCF